jgi:hypothetical protein
MSSLWTPGGEVPVDRNRPSEVAGTRAAEAPPATATPDGDVHDGAADDPELRAEYERMQREILDAPAGDVVAQHAMGLYELAAMHLSQPSPRLADVRLLIDALTVLLEGLEGRLGRAEQPLAEAIPQLKMAFVEATDRVRGSADETS